MALNGLNSINPNEQFQVGRLGTMPSFQPKVAPVSTGNEFGISIPQNHSYTTDTDGTRVAMGQDGVGLAHRNPEEYRLHLIA